MTPDEEKICDLEKEIVRLTEKMDAAGTALRLAANTGRANIALVLSAIGLILVIMQMFRK